jgi:hypothetical protein
MKEEASAGKIVIRGSPAALRKGTAGKQNDFLQKPSSIRGWIKTLWLRVNAFVPTSFFLQPQLGRVKKMVFG